MMIVENKSKIGQKILEKRATWFANIDEMPEVEIEILSKKWHRMITRYQVFVAKIKVRQFEQNGCFIDNSKN